jgi:hypothetical protein
MSLLSRYPVQSSPRPQSQSAALSEAQINAEYNAAAKAYAALKHTNDTTAVSAAYQRLTAARSQLQASVR